MSFWRFSDSLTIGETIDGYRVVSVREVVPPSVLVANHGARRHGQAPVPEIARRCVQLGIEPHLGFIPRPVGP